MNVIKTFLGAGIVLAATLVSTAHAAKPDFTQMAGTYRASYQLTSSSTSITSSNLAVTVTVPKNGNKAIIQIVGYAAANLGTPAMIAMLGKLNISRQKVTSDNALIALYVQLPSAALVSSSRNQLQFTLTNSSLGSSSAISMNYILRFNKRHFSIVGTGTLGSSPASVTMIGRKRHSPRP